MRACSGRCRGGGRRVCAEKKCQLRRPGWDDVGRAPTIPAASFPTSEQQHFEMAQVGDGKGERSAYPENQATAEEPEVSQRILNREGLSGDGQGRGRERAHTLQSGGYPLQPLDQRRLGRRRHGAGLLLGKYDAGLLRGCDAGCGESFRCVALSVGRELSQAAWMLSLWGWGWGKGAPSSGAPLGREFGGGRCALPASQGAAAAEMQGCDVAVGRVLGSGAAQRTDLGKTDPTKHGGLAVVGFAVCSRPRYRRIPAMKKERTSRGAGASGR